jgi:hypothetical protein
MTPRGQGHAPVADHSGQTVGQVTEACFAGLHRWMSAGHGRQPTRLAFHRHRTTPGSSAEPNCAIADTEKVMRLPSRAFVGQSRGREAIRLTSVESRSVWDGRGASLSIGRRWPACRCRRGSSIWLQSADERLVHLRHTVQTVAARPHHRLAIAVQLAHAVSIEPTRNYTISP